MTTDHEELSQRAALLMRAVIQDVRLERDPLEKVDRVLANVVHAGVLGGTLEEYRAAIDEALSRKVHFAALAPEYHPEDILRRFLDEIRRRIDSLN